FEGLLHRIAAQTTFLCVTCAMLLQSLRMRRDALWQPRWRIAFALALIAFIWLWVHALWREPPRGLMQKSVIALILTWITLQSLWLFAWSARFRRQADPQQMRT